jgi:predicted GNAT family N-acyltransferase
MTATFEVRTARWPEDERALQALRREVFVQEQDVPEEIEWDGRDAECLHAIAQTPSGEVIGCGRLLPDGHIGRMAVKRAWRGRGVGGALLEHLVGLAAQHGHRHVVLNAQTHAEGFYRRHAFAPIGEEFMEAGIAHRAMERVLR